MTVKDVAYNAIPAGDGHAAMAIYFSNETGCATQNRTTSVARVKSLQWRSSKASPRLIYSRPARTQ